MLPHTQMLDTDWSQCPYDGGGVSTLGFVKRRVCSSLRSSLAVVRPVCWGARLPVRWSLPGAAC